MAVAFGMVTAGFARLGAEAESRDAAGSTPSKIKVLKVTVEPDFAKGFAGLEKLIRAKSQPQPIAESVRPDMYPQRSDRDPVDVIVRRTEALLADLARRPQTRDLAPEHKELKQLKTAAETLRKRGESIGRGEFAKFGKLYRRISLANPLLDFDKVLFIKRHKSRVSHMCDQFLGRNARPGGGLYVLSDVFGPSPRLTDVLADSVVQNGRLEGSKLAGGSFLSPDLSFDGKTIVFAYCECGKDKNKQRPGWNLETCFHLFRVNSDGTNLVQLTDGLFNDFDPCWLPNGRICFISERRGGYGRCHGTRDAPSYTLASIDPDGGDLVFLSYNEANEWQPSVTNDGQIVYTRWDYLDRGTNQAHHPWVTSIDGRDPRAIHGNYPVSSKGLHDRPWMEMDIRAIPGSTKFVATAAGHHGQAYGSLVILDPRVADDGAMSQLRRLTPEVAFPEAERGGGDFATAWPLSENYFLCSDRGGIYLIDSFGGRQLIYRSKEVPCLSPIPLQARLQPPCIPHQTAVGLPPDDKQSGGDPRAKRSAAGDPATISVINIYDSLLPWPKETRIKALRIMQIIPKATPRAPGCGTGRTNIREVLGTVPVEEDGSVYFQAPTNKAIYFQALNERGLAVQSMRSVTYVHPGERLVCHGCHEPRHQAPAVRDRNPLAWHREPSEIRPDVEGSNPFDFDLLVKSVFDTKCNECHREKNAVKLDRKTAMKYVPHFISPKPYELSRTVPGKFGALGSRLLKYLDKSHHRLDLTADEFHRITLWMDCNAASRGSQQLSVQERQRLAEFASPRRD